MKYLAKTTKGNFLVDAPTWTVACEKLFHAGYCTRDEKVEMVCGFANEVRDCQQAMIHFITFDAMHIPKLAAAIKEYAEALVELSWIGTRDVESHAEIEADHDKARAEVERLLGHPLPKREDE